MDLLRTVTRKRGKHEHQPAEEIAADPASHASRGLALPPFLDISKPLILSHAEISALYFVVEDYFQSQIDDADNADPVEEARALARLLLGVIRRWNEADPAGICADLIELPWEE